MWHEHLVTLLEVAPSSDFRLKKQQRYLLGFSLVSTLILVINAREIRHNDRDGKGDYQHSRKGANATDHLTNASTWHHVTIPEEKKIVLFLGLKLAKRA